jgi:YD repeat-containing protein
VTQIRTFTYHANGKLATTTFPENGTTTYSYGAYGLLERKQDAKGQKIEYEYDAAQRLKVVRKFPVGWSQDDPSQRVTYHYDSNPFDPGMSVYTNGRLAAVEYGSGAGTIRESYAYHQAGAMMAKRMESGWVLQSGYAYDNEGRLTTLTYPNYGTTLAIATMWRDGRAG